MGTKCKFYVLLFALLFWLRCDSHSAHIFSSISLSIGVCVCVCAQSVEDMMVFYYLNLRIAHGLMRHIHTLLVSTRQRIAVAMSDKNTMFKSTTTIEMNQQKKKEARTAVLHRLKVPHENWSNECFSIHLNKS